MTSERNLIDMQYAPIALFTYNRADKTRTVVESLLKNTEAKDSELYIFSDGPKNEKAVEGVRKNREYIHEVKKFEGSGFRTVTLVERDKNWGLANSLIAGITELTDKYGKVIVVEDDLILSPYFLKFMNDGLEKYKDDDRVSAVSAFLNPIECNTPNTFFLRYFACWGWAVWKRSWDLLNTDAKDLLRQMRWKKNDFDIGGGGPFYGLLYCQKVGIVDSWAICFYASSFLKNKLVLYPGRTLTIQNGTDGSGTHSGGGASVYDDMSLCNTPLEINSIEVVENPEMYQAFKYFYRNKNKESRLSFEYKRFKSFVRRLIGIDYM